MQSHQVSLPRRLKKEPLIEAIFELRFESTIQVCEILAGTLFSLLDGDKSFERLPLSEIPAQMRNADANLAYSPLVRLKWDRYFISVGDRSLSVSCQYPYPGWAQFLPAILKILEHISGKNLISKVSRYALKYIDIIASDSIEDQIKSINCQIVVGGHSVTKEIFSCRTEFIQGQFVNAVQIANAAVAKLQTGKGMVSFWISTQFPM
jgi:uncharacterized protein (TIGR04255 family)